MSVLRDDEAGMDVPWPPRCPELTSLANIERVSPLHERFSSDFRCHSASVLPKLVEADVLGHLRLHEAWMYQRHSDTVVLEIDSKQLAHHVLSRLGSVMCIVAALLVDTLVPQPNTACLRADEDDLAARLE